MGARTQGQDRMQTVGQTSKRRGLAGAGFGIIETLEPRGMLSGVPVSAIPATLGDDAVVVATTAVVAGLRVMLPPSSPNGMSVTALIGAVDAAGMPVFSYNGSVTLASTDSSATLPSSVAIVNGRAVVPVTFRTAGVQTLTATDAADASRTATASTKVASPIVAAKLVVMMPPQVRAGVPVTVSALAVDATGRPVPSFSGSATVASSDAAATLPLIEVVFSNGRATFQTTFASAGAQTVTVTSLNDSPISGTGSTTVAPPQTLASFLVMAPPRVNAGTPVNVAIIALDPAKRPITGYSGTVTLASSDASATLPATVTFKAGRAVARVTFATAGSQTLSVRGGVAGDIVGTTAVTVVAAPVAVRFAVVLPRAVPANTPVTVTLVALTAQGKPVTGFSGSAALTSSDPAATLPASVTFVNGRAVLRVTFATLGSQTLTATSGSIVGSGTTQVGEVTIQTMR